MTGRRNKLVVCLLFGGTVCLLDFSGQTQLCRSSSTGIQAIQPPEYSAKHI
ncbi:hypothetical protein M758_8G176600 [Ceratodon purpureus]|nr:hypothetical protein M758_8G176600 [Ceratodon purpureus]